MGCSIVLDIRFQFRFPGTRTLTDHLKVDLQLPGNGITAIFGPSGSGKTTLLRCVAGLERPQSGQVSINGDLWHSDSTCLPTHQRPLGYVFQEASLFPHLTAQGNLDYGLKRCEAPFSQDLYDKVIQLLNIGSILPRRPHQLSGGERQRVAIARALLMQPKLLLMDEPLASLDVARKQEILPYLERLRSAFDVPILYVSHSVNEVARLADHVVLLEQGTVVAKGDVSSVFSRLDLPLPMDNDAGVVWRGRVTERDTRWHLARITSAGGDIWVRDAGDAEGQEIRLRILAKDVSLSLSCHEDSSIVNRLPVTVAEIVTEADSAMALVRLVAGDDHLIARLTNRSVDHLNLTPGMPLWAQIKSVAIVR